MEEKKPLAYIVLAVVIVVALGVWLFRGNNKDGGGTIGQEPVAEGTIPPVISLDAKLTPEEKSGDVTAKKAEILARVRSAIPLTVEEKREITLIMVTKANIYKFSEVERKAIFAAFNRR